ncbi:MAG: hypothetical protein IJU31_01605, partial [Synergistaceae bacterium]|nr:hypothetical protein [Synergistaceae bacterium]
MQKQSRTNKSQPLTQRSKKRKRKIFLYSFILIIFLLMMAAGGYSAYYLKVPADFWEEMIPIPDGHKINVSIENGMTASQAAR